MKYFKFIKWDGKYALFEKASIAEILINFSPLGLFGRFFNIKELDFILIKIPKRLL